MVYAADLDRYRLWVEGNKLRIVLVGRNDSGVQLSDTAHKLCELNATIAADIVIGYFAEMGWGDYLGGGFASIGVEYQAVDPDAYDYVETSDGTHLRFNYARYVLLMTQDAMNKQLDPVAFRDQVCAALQYRPQKHIFAIDRNLRDADAFARAVLECAEL